MSPDDILELHSLYLLILNGARMRTNQKKRSDDNDLIELTRLLDEHGRLRENGQDDQQALERLSGRVGEKITQLKQHRDRETHNS